MQHTTPYVKGMTVTHGEERKRVPERTRARLVEAAGELFREQGLEASLDAICERAGYTRGAFYVHFRDRDDFLVAAMDHVGRRFLDAVLPPSAEPHHDRDESATASDDLTGATLRFVASVADGTYPLGPAGGVRPHQLLAACARSARIRRRYVELVGEAIARVERLVVRGQREAIVRTDLPAGDVAVMLLAATIGAHTLLELRAPLDLARSAALLVTALAPPGVTPRDIGSSTERRRARSGPRKSPRPASR